MTSNIKDRGKQTQNSRRGPFFGLKFIQKIRCRFFYTFVRFLKKTREIDVQEIRPAIDMLKNLMTPKDGFHWGSPIWEPDSKDDSNQAIIKRKLILNANNCIKFAEDYLANSNNMKQFVFDKEIFEEIEKVLQDDLEYSEFTKLVEYTENLALVVNHRVATN